MYHSVVFQNASGIIRNTWDDWRLIPTAKPTFPSPEPQYKFVDVPGKNGSIDLSTYLTGGIRYSDRTGSFEFKAIDTSEDWDVRCNSIAKFLHGQSLKIYLEDDPFYYYEGRVTMSKNSGDKVPTITFNYRVGPYKIHKNTGDQAF